MEKGTRTAQLHFGDAGDGLQAILDHLLQHIGDLHGTVLLAVKGDPHHRLSIGLDLHDGLVHFVRQQAAHPPETVTHIVGRLVGAAAEAKLRGDLGVFRATDGGDEVQPLDAGEYVLHRLRYLRLHDSRGLAPG